MYLELTKAELFDLLNEKSVYKFTETENDFYKYYIQIGKELKFYEENEIEYYFLTKAIVIDLLRNFYYEFDKFEIKIIE